jgi:hypothetical protein
MRDVLKPLWLRRVGVTRTAVVVILRVYDNPKITTTTVGSQCVITGP